MSLEAYDNPTQSLDTLNFELAKLRVETDTITGMKDRTLQNTEKVMALLRRADVLEQKYIEWQKSLPAPWGAKSVVWIDEVADLEHSFVHPGNVYTYGDIWKAQTHNTCRCARIYTWSIILCCTAWLRAPQDYRISPEYQLGSHRCKHLIADIVASVPYIFGREQFIDRSSSLRTNSASDPIGNHSIKGLSSSEVMWSLFAAWRSDFASDSQRRFLEGRLTYMVEVMGIHQATMAIKVSTLDP